MSLKPQKYSQLSRSQRRELREQYITVQKGLCIYCNASLTGPPPKAIERYPVNWSLFPTGFMDHPIHLQHCHKTDMTEGAVHAKCNAVMWVKEGR